MNEKVAKVAEKMAKVAEKMAKNIKNKFICEHCDYVCFKKYNYNQHLNTAKHKNIVNCHKVAKVAEKMAKNGNFICETCNYISCKKSDYSKHLKTLKHKNNIVSNKENNNTIPLVAIDSSLNEVKFLTSIVLELVKSNNDLQKHVIDVCQKIQQPIINTNSNNKTFNLNLFLNEECKDAMNLSDFVNSIQLKLSDLENIGKVGYVEGISNIIIKQLNETQLTKRPVHCSDAKREILYVKEEDKWEKETEDVEKMVKAVLDVDKKASKLLITEWKEANPNLTNSNSKQSETFVNLVGEISNGNESNVKKVIKRVVKQVIIDK